MLDRAELLWRQYELHVSLYKHYLDLTVKVNGAYYAITGAVVTYVLAHPGTSTTRAGFFIPLVLGVGLVAVAVYGAIMLRQTRRELVEIRDELGLQTIPEVKILSLLLWLSSAGFLTVSVGVTVLWLDC